MKLKQYSKVTFFILVMSLAFAQDDHSSMNHSEHNQSHTTEEADFAEREQSVMPFDLNATLHIFQDTATGGIQQVIANDPTDQENIGLIRSHLQEEAVLFANGDFQDPSYLHGEAMPGLADLKEAGKKGSIDINYQNIDGGGQITYDSKDLSVIIALHLWFQAQVLDHGENATH